MDVGTRGMMTAFRALVTEVTYCTRTMNLDCVGALAMVSTGIVDMGSMGTMVMNSMTMMGTVATGSMCTLATGIMTMMGMAAMLTPGIMGYGGSLKNLDFGNLGITGIMDLGCKTGMSTTSIKVGTRMYDVGTTKNILLRDRTCRSSPQPPPLKFFPMMRTKSKFPEIFEKMVMRQILREVEMGCTWRARGIRPILITMLQDTTPLVPHLSRKFLHSTAK